MTLKSLANGIAAVAIAGAVATGVTSLATGASETAFGAPRVQPVVFGVPMPLDPAPNLAAPLVQTINALAGPGSFAGSKGSYIQGGLGRIMSIGADSKYNSAVTRGYLPLTASVSDIDENGPTATATVTATLATGDVRSMPLTFVQGPSPSGWQLSSQSVTSLANLMG